MIVELNSLADKKKFFVAVITERNKMDDDCYVYEVKFLTKKQTFFVFPQLEDVCSIDSSEIKAVLNAPSINARGHYKFSSEVLDNFNIE